MSQPIVLRRAAREEFDEAADWYEARQVGRGTQFVAAVQVVFDRIAANPKFYAVVRRDIRKAVVLGFPYTVYYREQPARVVVVAVFHSARDPKIWQGRS